MCAIRLWCQCCLSSCEPEDLSLGDDALLADPWTDGDFLPLHAFLREQWMIQPW